MKTALLLLAILLALIAVWKAFSLLWRRRRSGPSNNWKNEHFLAMGDDGTWAENGESVTHRDTNGPSIYPGIT